MDSDLRGFLFVVGTIITSISVGFLTEQVWGWLTMGCLILAAFLLEYVFELWSRHMRGK